MTSGPEENKVQTTAEEMEGFYIVRAILCAKVNVSRIVHRDQQATLVCC